MAKTLSARLKSWSLYLVTGFLALILLTSFFYRDDIFHALNDPGTPFQTYEPPEPLSYASDESWLAYPERGATEGPANIFVITPTQYLGGEHWNAPASRESYRSTAMTINHPNYVAGFSHNGRVYAPFYREAALYALMTNREDAQRARSLAHQDIRRAFQRFLAETPPERPIVLVGYEQGALHVQRLLQDYFSGDTNEAIAMRERLAAAYVIDYPLPLDLFESRLRGLDLCQSESDHGCVVAFGAFTERETKAAAQYASDFQVWDGRGLRSTVGRALSCTNPLTWRINSDYAPARLHQGAVAASGLEPGTEPAATARQFGAQCQDGLLIIDKPKSRSLRRPMRFGGKYIPPPYNLFYEDLKIDSLRRANSLIESGNIPVLAPPMAQETLIEDSPIVLTPSDSEN